jgi:hypothetical protein
MSDDYTPEERDELEKDGERAWIENVTQPPIWLSHQLQELIDATRKEGRHLDAIATDLEVVRANLRQVYSLTQAEHEIAEGWIEAAPLVCSCKINSQSEFREFLEKRGTPHGKATISATFLKLELEFRGKSGRPSADK